MTASDSADAPRAPGTPSVAQESQAGGIRSLVDLKAIVSGAIGFLVAASLGTLLGIGPQVTLPWNRSRVPAPQLADFIPADWRVVSRQDVRLLKGGPQQIALHVSGPEAGPGKLAPGNVLLIAWDPGARRWTKVFDGMRTISSYPQPESGFFDSVREPRDLKMITIRQGDGTSDFAFSANRESGFGTPQQVVGVVRLRDQVARLVYSFESWGSGTITRVAAGHDLLRITTNYYSGVDPHCCPVRDYSVDLLGSQHSGYDSYEPVSDDRQWSGAYVTHDANEVIVSYVAPNSPASGLLLDGDRILGVHAEPVPQRADWVIREIAKRRPGDSVTLDIRRGAASLSVVIPLASRIQERQSRADPPRVPDFGWTLSTVAGHAVVSAVKSSSSAASAGLLANTSIDAVDSTEVYSAAQVSYVLASVAKNHDVRLTVRTPAGERREVVLMSIVGLPARSVIPLDDVVTSL